MKKTKRSLNIKKVIILLLLLITLLIVIWNIAARYTNMGVGIGEIEIAMYVIEEGYQSMNVNLDKMVPQIDPYLYNFSISNYNEVMRTDVDLEYTLKIRTTTNIPLLYELYLNESYNGPDVKDIILSNTINTDEYETYFRTITTEPREFTYKSNQTDIYQLVIYFPITYKNTKYQDLIESVEIIVESKQIIEP